MKFKPAALGPDPIPGPRVEWAEAFQQINELGDDAPLDILAIPSDWDETEWEWE